MSKKKAQFEQGLQQIMKYLEFSFQANFQPTPDDILKEVQSLEGLKGVSFKFVISNDHPVDEDTLHFYMIREEYIRYDAVLPEEVQIWKLPAEQSGEKEIQQIIRLQPAMW